MPVRRTKRGCASKRRRSKRKTLFKSGKRRSKRFYSRSRRTMKGGSLGSRSLESVREVIENAVAKGQSGGTYGSSSGSSYGSSLYHNSKNMKKRKSRRS